MRFFRPAADSLPAVSKIAAPRSRQIEKRDTRPPLPANTCLDGFLFEKLAGRGSFSLVYSGTEIATGERVIIKEYFPKRYAIRRRNGDIMPRKGRKLIGFHEGFKRFFKEAMLLKKMHHPNLLATAHFFSAHQTAYFVSKNQDGRDLRWFISSLNAPLDQSLVYKVFMPILSALNFMHDAKLLHLDIKPANILLQPNGQPLLLDMGAVQRMGTRPKKSRSQVMTRGFSPPEQFDKNGSLGPWTDVFAAGASLYCSIFCKLPGTPGQKGAADERLASDALKGAYPASLLDALKRALEPDIDKRFATIDEFAAALLEESAWSSLAEYERAEMGYDRSASSILDAKEALIQNAA